MEDSLDKERKGVAEAKKRAGLGQAEIDEDEYVWRWQGDYRHKGLKECYIARKNARATGEYQVDVKISMLSPAELGDDTVTIRMIVDNDDDGEVPELDEDGAGEEYDEEEEVEEGTPTRKRARSETGSDTNSSSPTGSERSQQKRHIRKKARRHIPRSVPLDFATQAETLSRSVHGNNETHKKLQRIQEAAANSPQGLSRPRDASGIAKSRPPSLDLRAAQPSPDLPRVARPVQRQPHAGYQDPTPSLPPPGYQYPPPRYPLPVQGMYQPPPGTMMWSMPQPAYTDVQQQYNSYGQHYGQYQPQQHPQGPVPSSPMPRATPVLPQQSRVQRESRATPHWVARPPQPRAQAAHMGGGRPAEAPAMCPPPGTMMRIPMNGTMVEMYWEEFQKLGDPQRRPPSIEPAVQPQHMIRRGYNPNTARIPVPPQYRPKDLIVGQDREMVQLPYTMPYRTEPRGAIMPGVSYRQTESGQSVLDAANRQWSAYETINNRIEPPGARMPDADQPREILEAGAVQGARNSTEQSLVPVIDANTVVQTPEPDTTMAEAPDVANGEAAPASPTDSIPSRPRSAPVHDFHPPRRFATPPSLRKPPANRAAFADSQALTSVPPSSPVVPDSAAQAPRRSVLPPSTPVGPPAELEGTTLEGTNKSMLSEAETLVLTPTPIRAAVAPCALTDAQDPPSTPIRKPIKTAPSTPGSRTTIIPTAPAYHNAHHSPRRAEQAIDEDRRDAARRATLRATLLQLPEAMALGLGQEDVVPITPARMVAERGRWMSPPPGAIANMASSPIEIVVEEETEDEAGHNEKQGMGRKGGDKEKASTKRKRRTYSSDDDDDNDGDFDSSDLEPSSSAMPAPRHRYTGRSRQGTAPASSQPRKKNDTRTTRRRSGSVAGGAEERGSVSARADSDAPDTPTRRTRSGREFTPFAPYVAKPGQK
jgi:hypothetical protein